MIPDYDSDSEQSNTFAKQMINSQSNNNNINNINNNTNNTNNSNSNSITNTIYNKNISDNDSVAESTISHKLNSDEIEELKELIKNWLDLDSKIKVISDELKDIKMEKKQYENYILEMMDKSKKEVIKTQDNTLRKDVKQSKGSPKEDNILQTLSQILSDPQKAYEITQQILESVPSKEIISLKKEKAADPKSTKKTFKRK